MSKDAFLKTVMIIIGFALVMVVLMFIVGFFGSFAISSGGCFYRYNFDTSGNVANIDTISRTVSLKAHANYTNRYNIVDGEVIDVDLDPSSYGKWLSAEISVGDFAGGVKDLKYSVSGEVSLCRAYIPSENLQQTSALDNSGNKIPIPRVEDAEDPVELIFSANNGKWRNLTELFRDDKYVVTLKKDQKGSSVLQYNIFSGSNITANCSQNQDNYNAICGKYSRYPSNYQYISSCNWNTNCYPNPDVCCAPFCVAKCSRGPGSCWENVFSTSPGYSDDGRYNSPHSSSESGYWNYPFQQGYDCTGSSVEDDTNLPASGGSDGSPEVIMGSDYSNRLYFWFSADNAGGLLYRLDTTESVTSENNKGSGFSVAALASSPAYNLNINSQQQILIDENIFTSGDYRYLQYRFVDNDGGFGDNTGGYVLGIKQTKCRRQMGIGKNDKFAGRGNIQYVLANPGADPNDDPTSYTPDILTVDANGRGQKTFSNSGDKRLWLRIYNDVNDYVDSIGQYQIDFSGDMPRGEFYLQILDPLMQMLKDNVQGAAEKVFKNMTCYQTTPTANCTNFFNYVRGMLTLYVMFYGFGFLLGVIKVTQSDLVIRLVKISVVAGLLNESTFDMFNKYVFDFVTNFSDNIIGNMSGYDTIANQGVSNPLSFMDTLMTKIFFSKVFIGQILALLAMGLQGFFYFIIILIAIVMVTIVLLRAISVYLMAFIALAVLIGIAPLFLTFMLFEQTFYLFNNWVRFTFRYMIEPVILLAGIIVFTQLFTIMIDQVLSFSVCWKCAIPFKLPFKTLVGVDSAFLNMPLFCINWFAPHGMDYKTGQMGLSMHDIAIIFILGYAMQNYASFAAQVTAMLAQAGGASATEMGADLDQNSFSPINVASKAGQYIATKTGAEKATTKLRRGINTTGKKFHMMGQNFYDSVDEKGWARTIAPNSAQKFYDTAGKDGLRAATKQAGSDAKESIRKTWEKAKRSVRLAKSKIKRK